MARLPSHQDYRCGVADEDVVIVARDYARHTVIILSDNLFTSITKSAIRGIYYF